MKNLIFIVISVILVAGGAYLAYQGIYLKRRGGNFSVLSVDTPFTEAGVFVDDEFLGPTHVFRDDLKPGTKTIRVGNWVQKVTLSPGAQTVIRQDLGPNDTFTGGEIIWLEEADGATSLAVISAPDGAEVRFDGGKIGETPLVSSEVDPGEHRLTVSKPSYIARDINLKVSRGYKLNINVKLMLKPISDDIKKIDSPHEYLEIRDFSTDDKLMLSDEEAWAAGAAFYLKSYEISPEKQVNYFLDLKGNIYDKDGNLITVEQVPKTKEKLVIGYLGDKSVEGLSESATNTLNKIAEVSLPKAENKPQVEILPTGTGWLRVRSGPGLGNSEIAKVNIGEKFELLGEESGWYKIKLSEGQEGWISGQFAKKLEE